MYIDHSIYKLPSDIQYESLFDKIKLNLLKKIKKYSIKPVIILSGFADCTIMDKDKIIWPWFNSPNIEKSNKLKVNWDNGSIRTNVPLSCIFKPEYSKFHLFIQHLKTLGYINKFNYKVIPYDFRIIGEPFYMAILHNYFIKYIITLFQNSSHKVTIISYDFGCVLTQIFLNNIDRKFKEQTIDKSIMINPTFGGNIYSINHPPNSIDVCFSGILLQLPHPKFYGDLNKNFLNKVPHKIKHFYEKVILKFQEKSFNNPGVKVVIIRNIYCQDIIYNIFEKIIKNFVDCKLVNVRIKNDNDVLSNKKILDKLISLITN